jgi:hypothetical protein
MYRRRKMGPLEVAAGAALLLLALYVAGSVVWGMIAPLFGG